MQDKVKAALDWLKQRWVRIVLSLIMVGSGVIMLYTVSWTRWTKVGFVGLGLVTVASWWVGWPEEEKDE